MAVESKSNRNLVVVVTSVWVVTCEDRLKSPTMTLPCPPSCESSRVARAASPSARSDVAGDEEAPPPRSEPVDVGGTASCCRGLLPHVDRCDRAASGSALARRSCGAGATSAADQLPPPPPPPRRSDWTAWNQPPRPSGDDELAARYSEFGSTV